MNEIQREVQQVASRLRWQRIGWSWLAIGLVVLSAAAFWLYAHGAWGWSIERAPGVLLATAGIGGLMAWWLCARANTDVLRVARRIESRHPELDSRLLTAISLPLDAKRAGYFQRQLVRETLTLRNRRPWSDIAPAGRVALAQLLGILAMIGVGIAALIMSSPRLTASIAPTLHSSRLSFEPTQMTVEPGHAEVERGTGLLVLARFSGRVPPEVRLEVRREGSEPETQWLQKSLDDPLFATRIPAIEEPLLYSVAFDEGRSEEYQVTVFELPRLQKADARLTYPEFTGEAPALIEDFRRVTAVEGTVAELIFQLNKPVAAARLVALDRDQQDLVLEQDAADASRYVVRAPMTESRRYRLALEDDQGRANRVAPEFSVVVVPNSEPRVKVKLPGRDLDVSALEEIQLQAEWWDDFGLVRHGVAVTGSQNLDEMVLGESLPGKTTIVADHLLALEPLDVQADDLISYYFWAEDRGPDGSIRRVESDMYFAEVRPFDEIFRQGQQPTESQQQQRQQQQQQGQQQGQGQAEQLLEIQKQIISATWNVRRRERGAEPTAQFAEDMEVILESQQQAREQAEQAQQQVQDERARQFLQQAIQEMRQAEDLLGRAGGAGDRSLLNSAVQREQAVLEALLKLRAREHEVVRQQQQQQQQQQSNSQSRNSQNSRSQQQLNQMELRDQQQQYEGETQAAQEEDPAARETRQVLNRLRDLARRQADLNRRINELQVELQRAESQEEREELERQLKRLREQQEQMLRDVDELLDRMDQPENQQPMSEQREQLEQSRENVRRASEALEENRMSQALSEGSRAQESLEQLREEFRRQASSEFQERMEQMREQADQLAQDQRRLSEQLEQSETAESRSLRETPQSQEVGQTMRRQGERFEELIEDIKQTVQDAETSEPLLSRRLYDTFRQTEQQRVQEALDTAPQWFESGFEQQAREAVDSVRPDLDKLQQGVREAAEAVMGTDTEALRRARDELRRLNRELEQEIQRNDPRADDRQEPRDGQQQNSQEREQGSGQEGQDEQDQRPGQPGQPRRPGQEGEQAEPGQRQGQSGQDGQQQGQQQEREQGEQDGEQEGRQDQLEQDQPERGQGQGGRGQEGRPGQEQSPEQSPGQRPGSGSAGGQGQPDQQDPLDPQDRPEDDRQPAGRAETPQAPADDRPDQQGRGRGGSLRDNPDRMGGARNELGGARDALGGFWGSDLDVGPAPLTGDQYREWIDRLRDVEEMVNDPELRAEAAAVRDRAQQVRQELKRHSVEPNWEVVRQRIAKPLADLADRVSDEILRRTADQAAQTPLDRDPAPPEFREQVRRYREQVGSGR